ncbi:virulence protein [Enterocloster clostridioformis]|uniref:virulence protein n=1 Tax=Enterocloster clostridioformis TaxID=1531 RepID=UPI0018AB7BFD|nr:virulence protein [Enterocloster clostridioformis]MDB2127482.1 virulence protein [Enterocloster clostridioformis]
MKVNYNVTGNDRKALVKVISDTVGEKAKYMGMPSAAYQIGAFTVSKTGELECEEGSDTETVLEALSEAGFAAEDAPAAEETETAEEEPAGAEVDGLTIQIPRSSLSDEALENLKRIIESKATLIKAALKVDDLPIEVDDERISFPWFPEPEAETSAAAIIFISKLAEMARNAKRVTATDKEVDNPKYAFRCFLLRLGLIGAEYKDARKTLLKNLTGNSSWKNGKKEAQDDEITE